MVSIPAECDSFRTGCPDESGGTEDGIATPIGHQLIRLPVPPRIGRVLVSAQDSNAMHTVATVAALIAERDIFRSPPEISGDSDLELRIDAIERHQNGDYVGGLSRGGVHHLIKVRNDLLRLMGVRKGVMSPRRMVQHILTGFPDRVAQRRSPGTVDSSWPMDRVHGSLEQCGHAG